MGFVVKESVEWHQNRPGSQIRTISEPPAAAARFVQSLGLIEQICAPGVGAPLHWHEFDEALQVVEGVAEVWIDAETQIVGPGVWAFFPAGSRHGFLNVGTGPLRIQGAFAARELATNFVSHEERTVRADRPIDWEFAPKPVAPD